MYWDHLLPPPSQGAEGVRRLQERCSPRLLGSRPLVQELKRLQTGTDRPALPTDDA